MKMVDFTHTKRPDFLHLVLIIAIVCLALGAITPAASAVDYDWEFSVQSSDSGVVSGTINLGDNQIHDIPNALPDGLSLYCQELYFQNGVAMFGYGGVTLTEFIENSGIYTQFPSHQIPGYYFYRYFVEVGGQLTDPQEDVYVRLIADFLQKNTDIPATLYYSDSGYNAAPDNTGIMMFAIRQSGYDFQSFSYSYESAASELPLYVDVVDSGDDYQISVSGFDGTQLAGSAYTIAVSTYSGGYNLPLTSFPMYLGDSPVHLWTSDQTFTLPVYLSDGITPIDYYCVMSFPADPTATGYPFWWNMTTHGSSEYPFNTTYPPVVVPTPQIPSDIIPDPSELNNTVNITGWYQEQGYEGNNITAPIYSGLRGWFNDNLIPVIDFFLVPTNYVATVIYDSAETSTDGISYITEELGSYAAPFNTVGAYVVRLVPEVVWLVVFAALSIGYVILLIKISTGSIRDTIGRFLGGSK